MSSVKNSYAPYREPGARTKARGVWAVLPVDLDRGGRGLAIVADGY